MNTTIKRSPFFRLLRRHQNHRKIGISKFSELRHFLQHYLFDDFEPEFLDFGEAYAFEHFSDDDKVFDF